MCFASCPFRRNKRFRSIGREFYDGERATRLQRLAQARVHRGRISEVVIHVANEDPVAALGGKVRARRIALDHFNILHSRFLHGCFERLEGTSEFCRVNLARWPDVTRHRNC